MNLAVCAVCETRSQGADSSEFSAANVAQRGILTESEQVRRRKKYADTSVVCLDWRAGTRKTWGLGEALWPAGRREDAGSSRRTQSAPQWRARRVGHLVG